jgi:hypothetical protein
MNSLELLTEKFDYSELMGLEHGMPQNSLKFKIEGCTMTLS